MMCRPTNRSKGQKKVKDDLVSVDFSWEVQNFSKLNNFKHYSDVFAIDDYKWQILLYPRGNNVDFLSVYLVVVESSKLPPGWSRYVAFSLTLVNQLHPSNSKTLGTFVFLFMLFTSHLFSFVFLLSYLWHETSDCCIIIGTFCCDSHSFMRFLQIHA
ncbi:hypothetical protein COP2_007534 [Malus domestica]